MSLFPSSVLERVCPHCVLLPSASAQSLFWFPGMCACSHPKASLAMLMKSALLLVFGANVITRSHRQELAFVLSSEGRWSQVSVADLVDKVTVIYFSDCWWCGDMHCPHHQGIQGERVNSRVCKYFSAFIFHILTRVTQCCSLRWHSQQWGLTLRDLIWVSWAEAWAASVSSQQPPPSALK